MSLVAATRSESVKLFSTSMWWVLGIILVGYVAFTASALGFAIAGAATGAFGEAGTVPVPTDGLAAMIYSTATAVGYVFPLLIGTLIVTAEFRHKTLTPTFLATPRRATVLSAKLGIGALVGVIFGVLGIVASVGPAAGFLSGFGLDTDLTSSDTWAMLGRMLLAFVLWTWIGVGVGALVRNQVGAVVGVLVFTQFLEPVVRTAAAYVDGLSDVVAYLPGAASDALVGASIFSAAMPAGSAPPEWWVGGIVLLAYAVLVVALGYVTSWRRDVS